MNTQLTNNTQRILGKTGFSVGEIGLGAWQIGGDWGDVSKETALATLCSAHENGVNFIDTAMGYGGGRSERLIGRFLRDIAPQSRVYVATKVPRDVAPTIEAMERAVTGSLERLGVDSLDLLQLHCWPLVQMQSEIWDVLTVLQERGLIKHFGASVESVEEALFCIREAPVAALQIIFNLFRQKPGGELFPVAQTAGVGLIVRLPLASGLLSGKFGAGHEFESGDHRNYNADGAAFNVGETFAGLPFKKGVELVARVREIVGDAVPLSQIALRWILDFDAVSVIIPGAKSPAQAAQNVAATSLPPLSPEVHAALRTLYQTEVEPHIRGAY